jgi:hypothetical protein
MAKSFHAGCGLRGAQALDAGHGALGLVLFGVAVDHAHRLALAQFREQVLGNSLGLGPITLLAARRMALVER